MRAPGGRVYTGLGVSIPQQPDTRVLSGSAGRGGLRWGLTSGTMIQPPAQRFIHIGAVHAALFRVPLIHCKRKRANDGPTPRLGRTCTGACDARLCILLSPTRRSRCWREWLENRAGLRPDRDRCQYASYGIRLSEHTGAEHPLDRSLWRWCIRTAAGTFLATIEFELTLPARRNRSREASMEPPSWACGAPAPHLERKYAPTGVLSSPNKWVKATQGRACFRMWWDVGVRRRSPAVAPPWAPYPER
jgi:hypothetical protein